MLTTEEQERIAGLAEKWVRAERRALQAKQTPLYPISPNTATRTAREARAAFLDELKEAG